MEHLTPRSARGSPQARITDLYIITMLLVFPLFPGFSGYASITRSKFLFLLCATGAWLAVLLLLAVIRPGRCSVPKGECIAAALLLAVSLLSALLSPDRASCWLGAGRYDGLLSTVIYVLIFLGIALTAQPRLLHLRAFALSVTLCLVLGLVQLTGRNPLGLYPGDLTYYDSGVRYTGAFLGTVGSINILDAVLCLALPACCGVYIADAKTDLLLPLLPGIPLLLKTGGDGARLALSAAALVSLPLLLTDIPRVRRALRTGALTLLLAGAALCWSPLGEAGHFSVTLSALIPAAAAAVPLLFSLLPMPEQFRPSQRDMRRFFCLVSFLLLLTAVLLLFFVDMGDGALHEAHLLLHGNAEDSFGSSRIGIWRRCLELARERPLLGLGPGALALHADITFSRFFPALDREMRVYVDNAHNVYLGALVNNGILGLLALMGLYALCVLRTLRRIREPIISGLALGAFCCAVQEFFGLGLCISEPLLWICFGLLCSRNQHTEELHEN